MPLETLKPQTVDASSARFVDSSPETLVLGQAKPEINQPSTLNSPNTGSPKSENHLKP